MTYYLVQRLETKAAPFPSDKGFDRYFRLDYMGSSEFEWGAIPKALKSMRQQPADVQPESVTINGTTKTVYFVGPAGTSKIRARQMELWAEGDRSLRRPPFCGKEFSGFGEAFSNDPNRWLETDAWWSIEDDIAWSMKPEVAECLARAFNEKPVSR